MDQKLKGKKAIVAGGSRGIGKAIVLELARHGADVLFTYRSNVEKAKESEKAAKAFTRNVVAVKADLTNKNEMDNAFEALPNHLGASPDFYIGVAFPPGVFVPTGQLSEDDYNKMFDAVRGHYFALQKASLSLNKGGKIVVFSSGSAAMPTPAAGAYGGAKAALEKFALSLSKELGEKQITVNVVSPGVTKTDGLVAPQELIDSLVAQTPLGRLGEVDDLAKATVQILMPEMNWVNGQVIQVNGGIL